MRSSATRQLQAWGAWWALTLYARYVRCLASKRPFRTQAWARLPFGPPRLRSMPLEPFIKVLLPLMGVLGGEETGRGQGDRAEQLGSSAAAAMCSCICCRQVGQRGLAMQGGSCTEGSFLSA